ncbi:MAG: hypothetical protein JOZ69_00425, partial [Myxococcales bacterium]|nr:hypothetical protein [Myxococcales bacterium]
LLEAIRRADGTDPIKIQQALEHMTLVTPNGKYRYSPTDHSGLRPEYISVNVVRGGEFVPTEWARQKLVTTVAED